jgi:hypothetical protein
VLWVPAAPPTIVAVARRARDATAATGQEAAMNWQEAKRSTIAIWQSIHDSIGTTDPVSLLTEINGITDLCALAKDEATTHGDLAKCHYCPAYEQFGGCQEVSAMLSDLVVRHEWQELRARIEDFIARLERMDAPGMLQTIAH